MTYIIWAKNYGESEWTIYHETMDAKAAVGVREHARKIYGRAKVLPQGFKP
jgi:hypothetical protein